MRTSTVPKGAPPSLTVDNWSDKDQKIQVKEDKGFHLQLQLRARIDAPPEEVFHILTDPACASIFRNIKACTYRKDLGTDKSGVRKLEVGHRAIARFLFINVTFETHLFVWEDTINRTIKFTTARQGFMKRFDGMWHIKPFNQETLDQLNEPQIQTHQHHNWFRPAAALSAIAHKIRHGAPATVSLVTLEQVIVPKAAPPIGTKALVRSLCAKQLQNMMEDLRKELGRRKQLQGEANAAEHSKVPHTTSAIGVAAATAAASITNSCCQLWEEAGPLNVTVHL